MAPSVTMNIESDFVTPKPRSFDSLSPSRSLLLSPPSLSSHPEKLNKILAAYDRAYTDIQMLDRLSLSLVSLPDSTYDNILILLDADGTRRESEKLLNRDVFCHIAKALKPNGRLKSQDGTFALTDTVERREAIFAGLLIDKNEMAKPGHEATQSVPLRFGKTQGEHGATASSQTASTTDLPLNKNGKRTSELSDATPLSGVDFVEFGDDLDDAIEESDNEELIDEDTLLNDEDLTRPIIQPPSCRPPTGKRRRACKDCTCGLAQRLEAEDSAKRSTADQNLAKLNTSDLAEVDFTVQGKVGSCGNCALGDAFRCDGCPYIGLPAFKNGEVVRLEEGEGNVHL